MRRLLAAAGTAALGLAVLAPVALAVPADSVHKLEWWTPYSGAGKEQPSTAPDQKTVFSNDEVVTAEATFNNDGVQSWEIVLRPVSGGQPTTCREAISDAARHVYMSCPWDTTRAVTYDTGPIGSSYAGSPYYERSWQKQDLGPATNGKYTIEVRVTSVAGQETCPLLGGPCQPGAAPTTYELFQTGTPRWREVYVANEVSKPAGVSRSYDSGGNRISVTWAPNPEPDISKYVVQEKVGSGAWKPVADVPGGTTRYDRVIESPGTYQYQVAAVRPAPAKDKPTVVKQSAYVAAEAVDIASVTPPTTAPAATPSGDPGDPGVSLPSDAPPTTGPGRAGPGPGKVTAPGKGPLRPGSTGVSGPGASRRPPGTAVPGGEEGEEPDGGFSTALPYKNPDGTNGTVEEDVPDEVALPGSLDDAVTIPKPKDTRAMMVFLACGLVMLLLAAQLTIWVRRRPAMAVVEDDDFADWLRY